MPLMPGIWRIHVHDVGTMGAEFFDGFEAEGVYAEDGGGFERGDVADDDVATARENGRAWMRRDRCVPATVFAPRDNAPSADVSASYPTRRPNSR